MDKCHSLKYTYRPSLPSQTKLNYTKKYKKIVNKIIPSVAFPQHCCIVIIIMPQNIIKIVKQGR